MRYLTKSNLYSTLAEILPSDGFFLEAGAFNGKDTLILSQHFPQATIYAFEPLPEIYAELQKNTQSIPCIKTYQVALSDKTGTATFYVADHPKRPGKICQAGTLLKPHERLNHSPITYPHTTQVPTTTIDVWARQNGIDRLDFMWLHLQGNELAVLQASPTILPTARALYVELNFIQAYAGQPTAREVHEWICGHGFELIGTDYQDQPTHFFGNHLYFNKNSNRK